MKYRDFCQSLRLLLVLISISLWMVLQSPAAMAAQVRLAWDANTETDLAGYKLHYGTTSGNYNQTVDVGNQTNFLLTGLTDGQTYYFAATAYDTAGLASGYSNEVSWTMPSATTSGSTSTSSESIVDNGGAGTTASGTWKISGGSNPYGTNSLYSNAVGATYTFQKALSGTTDVSMWWTTYSNRDTAVPVEIYNGSTLLDVVYVNQQTNGGKWNLLGTYTFTGTARVVVRTNSNTATTKCADAVKFAVTSAGTSTGSTGTGTILDNGGTGTSASGTWLVSGGAHPYGTNSLYSNQAGATYTFQVPASGAAAVSLWWTIYSNRSTAVPVKIFNGTTLLKTLYVNQQTNGGQWNPLGTYTFTGTARVVVGTTGNTSTTSCADAVRLVAQ
ncbi:MAG: fibronectin type III domain-containing protein [Desulfobacteraceae bacterium]|nr:fibronectin type III domain-containing protein [Desulfobacteraceae bacterium]